MKDFKVNVSFVKIKVRDFVKIFNIIAKPFKKK